MANFVYTYSAPAGDGSVDITVEEPSALVAPAQIWLTAENVTDLASFEETGTVYDGAHHEYYYDWRINGAPLSSWAKTSNLLSAHNDPNHYRGPQVGILLPDAAEYTITLTVTDRLGNTATNSVTRTVVTPESYFADADRIYVDPDGDFTGVPAGADTATTLENLRTKFTSHQTNPTWVLLRKGKEHSLVGVDAANNSNFRDTIYFDDSTSICYVSGFGTGDDPVITQGDDVTRNATNPMFHCKQPRGSIAWRTFTGLRFEGDYNPETWHGRGFMGAALSIREWKQAGGFCLFHNITTTGTGYGYSLPTSDTSVTQDVRVMVADCGIDGWRDYGFFGGSPKMKLSIIGNSIRQKANTPNSGDQDGTAVNHGPVRIPYAAYTHFSMNDLFSRGGWDGNDQACLRLYPSQTSGQIGYVDRCSMSGGFEIIHLRRSSANIALPGNIVIEKVLTIGTGDTTKHIHSQRSGVTIRDCIMIEPNSPRTLNYGIGAIYLTPDTIANQDEANEDEPIVVYGNTYLILANDANDGSGTFPFINNDGGYFSNITNENNVTHRPNAASPDVPFAPIDIATAISGFDSTYNGHRENFGSVEHVLGSSVANNTSFVLDYADVTEGVATGQGNVSAAPATDQAYWQAIEDTDTDHQIYRSGADPRHLFYANLGHFTVSFDASEITITNTSGFTWDSGWILDIRLDRTSLQDTMDATYAVASTVPLPRPQTGSAAIDAATAGRVSPEDFLMVSRGATPSKGALEPA